MDAAYAAWPIWPSNAATDDTLTIAPRSPSASGSLRLIAVAAMRTASKVPTRLIATTFLKASRSWAESYSPSLPTVRCAQPIPAEQTRARRVPSDDGPVDGRPDLGGVGDVDGDELAADLARDRLALLGVEVGHHDLRAERGQLAGAGRADARRASGDDGRCSLEVHGLDPRAGLEQVVPRATMTAGPVSSTWSSAVQVSVSVPPGTSTRYVAGRGAPSAVAVATSTAPAPVPHDRVSPEPRSCTRMPTWRSPRRTTSSTLTPSG